jgi:outer membrane receptor protein involved in Fe transport
LRDDQVRFFIDGIPLEMSPYTFGISSIPVNLIERVDIYHGVVPIKFGADALAGAVNLITDEAQDSADGDVNGALSLQYGDFNTLRSTLNLNYADEKTGFFTRFNGFKDSSDNDYDVDVKLANEFGTVQSDAESVSVKRFHDAYKAEGINLDLGLRQQSWAQLFQLSVYKSDYFKDIQHSRNMGRVYGEPTVERQTKGANVRYEHQLTNALELELAVGMSEVTSNFIDLSEYRYNWLGEEITGGAGLPVLGEISINSPCNCETSAENQFARVNLAWAVGQGQQLNLSLAPSWNTLTRQNHYDSGASKDITQADRDMSSLVVAAEHGVDVLDDKLQNSFFIKHYSQQRQSLQWKDNQAETQTYYTSDIERMGWGNQSRYRFNEILYGKFSYEYATRLPSAAEAFGDSVNIVANPELTEEVSHNFNLSLALDNLATQYGSWKAEVNYFIRDVDDLIALRPYSSDSSRYENIAATESKGVHASAAWVSTNDFVSIDLNTTKFDFTNTSQDGLFEKYNGSRMPNVPYLFFNSALGLNWMSVIADYDELNLSWHFKYIKEFGLFWDGVGKDETNPVVPNQKNHSLSLTYSRDLFPYTLTVSAEVQNLTDEKLYDYFGVQRPGRAFYVKSIIGF